MGERVRILGVGVDPVTGEEAVERIAGFIATGQPHQVVTVNPEFVMAAQRDEEFRQVLEAAALAVPDGIGLVWAARLLGSPLPQRVAGVDLVERIAARAAREGWRIFLLGALGGVAETAAMRLRERYLDLQIAGTYAGSPCTSDEEGIAALVRRARPDMLLVAYGAPVQDKWIARNQGRMGVPVAIGVGGALDFIAGRARRAPPWVQRLGLEWLHRLICQPWRWRRMLALPRFTWAVLRCWWQQRRRQEIQRSKV